MVIGIDSSRAFISEKTGTENYSYNVITEMLRLPEARKNSFVLFIRPNAILPSDIHEYDNVVVKQINFPYLWTQLGLAWETRFGAHLDVLWIPAHTLPVLRPKNLKTVVTIHGLEYQWLPEYKNILQKWYLPLSTFYAANSATKLIAVSKFTANQLEKQLHTDKKKIKVIHEGVSEAMVEGEANILGKLNLKAKRYILFVGTVQPRKNLVSLVESFSQFIRMSPDVEDYKLVIAGGIGWMAEDILLATNKFGVEEKVVFTGRVNDLELHELYLGASIYVQPSITEGFGLPVLEAMRAEVPVISSNGGALAEVVGNAGIVIPINDDFAINLSSSMHEIATNPMVAKKLVSAGIKRVQQFTWVKAAKSTLDLLNNL